MGACKGMPALFDCDLPEPISSVQLTLIAWHVVAANAELLRKALRFQGCVGQARTPIPAGNIVRNSHEILLKMSAWVCLALRFTYYVIWIRADKFRRTPRMRRPSFKYHRRVHRSSFVLK